MHSAILLLDFDGTVCLGEAPVLAYADAVAARMLGADGDDLRRRLGAFLAGGTGEDFVDGYAAVAAYSAGRVSAEDQAAAYLASRRLLAAGDLHVWAPPGFADFLAGLSAGVRTVLVTNAPRIGITETLAALGLGSSIDEVITDAAKPGGMESILDELLADVPARSLMSIGDIWRNDLEIPHRRGCVTALIDHNRTGDDRPTLLAEHFEDLYPIVREWSSAPKSFDYRTLTGTRKGTS
nr:haloacid dehalogenase-like hydrolase [Rhodococcus sp. (in: high G+C Gram-positive bacteria)]